METLIILFIILIKILKIIVKNFGMILLIPKKPLENIKKTVAVIVVTCFTFSFILSQPIQAVLENKRNSSKFEHIFDEFAIPSSTGRITKVKDSGSRQLVINIQDLHCHPEVQRNIAKIISILDKRYGLRHVYSEGAYGQVDTSWLCQIKDKTIRETILEEFVNSGRLTGEEYYSVKHEKTDLLIGIDDKKLHTENLIRLNKIVNQQDEIQKTINELQKDLDSLQKKYYSRQNKKLDRVIQKYKKNNSKPAKYYGFLTRTADKLNINLDNYSNITAFLKSIKLNKKLNFKKGTREMSAFLSMIKHKLPYKTYSKIVSQTNNFTQVDELYRLLSKIAQSPQFKANEKHFPSLYSFFNYLSISSRINPIQLIKEEQRLITEIKLKQAREQAEKDVLFLVGFTRHLRDYLSYKVSVEDYEYVKNNISRYNLLWVRYIGNNEFMTLVPYFELLDKYYQVNLARNECFLDNCKIQDAGCKMQDAR